jgi:hypothetical protein
MLATQGGVGAGTMPQGQEENDQESDPQAFE